MIVLAVLDQSLFSVLAEPFRVAFVRTMHTVEESVGSVEVCVNLTRPGIDIDILDEFVFMRVIDDPDSVYIPNNTVLASKWFHYVHKLIKRSYTITDILVLPYTNTLECYYL